MSEIRAGSPRLTWARVLSVAGVVLVGIPLAIPLATSVAALIARAGFHLDVLAVGEFVVVAAVGGVLVFAAALILRARRMLAGVLLAAMLLSFLGVDLLALLTGLATGEAEAGGWRLIVVLGCYALYVVSVVGLFVAGILVCRDAFRRRRGTRAPLAADGGGAVG